MIIYFTPARVLICAQHTHTVPVPLCARFDSSPHSPWPTTPTSPASHRPIAALRPYLGLASAPYPAPCVLRYVDRYCR